MFSNGQNARTIGRLVDICEHYIGLQTEYAKFDVIGRVVRLIAIITLVVALSIIMILALTYVSFVATHTLELHVGLSIGFLTVAGGYLFIFLLFLLFHGQWIERPPIRSPASLLMGK